MENFYLIFVINILVQLCCCKQFFIGDNNVKCVLIDIRASITLSGYSKNKETRFNVDNGLSGQSNRCSNSADQNYQTFLIDFADGYFLNFTFNKLDSVILSEIAFSKSTNMTTDNKVLGIASPNIILSSPNKYFECSKPFSVELSNNILLNISYIKVQAFNVISSSFSSQKDECFTKMIVADKSNLDNNWSNADDRNAATNAPTPKPNTNPVFKVKRSDNITCLIFEATMNLNITYENDENKTIFQTFPVTSDSSFTGSCNDTSETLIIDVNNKGIFLGIVFGKQHTMSHLDYFTVNYNLSIFHDAEHTDKIVNEKSQNNLYVPVGPGHTYVCNRKYNFSFPNKDILSISHIKFESFHSTPDEDFIKSEVNCESKNPLVAIVIGVLLAVFLLIVVIVFIVFRIIARRNRAYQLI